VWARHRMSFDELRNRWIVPLEKRFDYQAANKGQKSPSPVRTACYFQLRPSRAKKEYPDFAVENYFSIM
jgi:hypothetical protein